MKATSKSRRPRVGAQAQASALIDKLDAGAPLAGHEGYWLAELLRRILRDEDVRDGFYCTVEGARPSRDHWSWVALDAKLETEALRSGASPLRAGEKRGRLLTTARKRVAVAWHISPATVRDMEDECQKEVARIMQGADPVTLARVVAMHRKKYFEKLR